MKIFKQILLSGWIVLALGVLLIFAFPKFVSAALRPIAPFYQLIPMMMLIATAGYFLVRVYTIGRGGKK